MFAYFVNSLSCCSDQAALLSELVEGSTDHPRETFTGELMSFC